MVQVSPAKVIEVKLAFSLSKSFQCGDDGIINMCNHCSKIKKVLQSVPESQSVGTAETLPDMFH